MSHSSAVLAGRYRLVGRIASGASGEVWRAADLVLDRPVAVKLLRAEYVDHPDTLARFRAEARHAGSLSHPHIAQVHDYREADPPWPPYLVMELVNGPSLAQVLTTRALSHASTMDVVAQAAEGLQAAHHAGLVHRDIKPGNLLIGPGGQVKITDFGISHAAGSAPITRTGLLVGTPAYLPPERAGGEPATPASDLYSLGVVAYECLTGAAPFSGTPLEVALAHRHRALPPLPPAVPPAVAALVGTLTAKDPAARPASGAEVARLARQLRDVTAGSTAPFTGTMPAPPLARLDETVAATVTDGQDAAPASVATTLSGAPTTLTGQKVPHTAPAGTPRRDRRAWARRGLALSAGAAAAAGLAGWLLAGVTQTAAPGRHVAASQPPSRSPSAQAARTVDVNSPTLTGKQVSVVRRLLRQRGLEPRVVWVTRGHQAPGTVVSVQPSGQVPAGTSITVVATALPPGRGNGQGNGNGQGTNAGS